METSPPRHPSAQRVPHGSEFRRSDRHGSGEADQKGPGARQRPEAATEAGSCPPQGAARSATPQMGPFSAAVTVDGFEGEAGRVEHLGGILA